MEAVNVALLAFYWSTLAYAAVRTYTLIARALPSGVEPTNRRLRRALLLTAWHTSAGGGLCLTAALALLAAFALQAGRNLDRPTAT
ncbi:hypothetical protein ACPPVO_35430 [Dactylosporangium sp. McL0621]|uniref:hypothetical protein n=1 Tax=Dactylosporangium sp. McL0621 TaxID=3415678 RepID=UPI003CFB5DBC